MTHNAYDSWLDAYEEACRAGYDRSVAQTMADDSIAPVFGRWLEADRVHAEALYENADRDDSAAWEQVLSGAPRVPAFGTQIHAYAERVNYPDGGPTRTPKVDAWDRPVDQATVTLQRDGYETRTITIDVMGRDVYGALNAAARVASNEGPNWEPADGYHRRTATAQLADASDRVTVTVERPGYETRKATFDAPHTDREVFAVRFADSIAATGDARA